MSIVLFATVEQCGDATSILDGIIFFNQIQSTMDYGDEE